MGNFFFGESEQGQERASLGQVEASKDWRVDVGDEGADAFHFGQQDEQEIHLRNLKQSVQGIAPQHVSAAFEVARKTGINPAVAMADPERFREELEATPEWEKLKEAPATQAHLNNPIMMAASQGDIKALTDTERIQAALAYGGSKRVVREKAGKQAVDNWYSEYTPDVELGFWHNIGGSLIEGFKAAGRGVDHFFAAGSEQMMGSIHKSLTDLGYTSEQVTGYLENGTPLPLFADEEYKGSIPWYLDPGNSGSRPEHADYHKRTMREKVAVLNEGGFPQYFYNFMKWVSEQSRAELDPDSAIGSALEADKEFLSKVARKGGVHQFASDTMFGVASMANMMVFSLLGHPEVGVGLMYSQIAGSDIEKGEKAGTDGAVNWRAANWNAFLQTPLEALGISKALSVWKPQRLLGKRFKGFVESVATEGLTEGLQAIPEELAEAYRMSNAEDIFEVKDFFQRIFTAEFLRKSGYQAAVGAASAGLIGGPSIGYHAIFSRGEEGTDPIKALKDGIDALGASKESVVVLENFTGEMVKGGHLPEMVYFPARQVAALFQDENLPEKLEATLELMDIDRAEFEAALEADGELQVSGAKLGPLMASPYRDEFGGMVHLNPVEREAVGIVQSVAQELEAGADFTEAAVSAAELAAAEAGASEPVVDASPYRERIQSELMEKGKLSRAKAEAYAALIDANAHIWASLPGESIDSYYERYGYQMHRTDFGEVLAQVYEAHGKSLGLSSEMEFFNRYKADDTFREQVNAMLQFGAKETGDEVAKPFVLDVDSLIDAGLPDLLNNAGKVEELLAGGYDGVQVNVGGQSYVYALGAPSSYQFQDEEADAQKGGESTLNQSEATHHVQSHYDQSVKVVEVDAGQFNEQVDTKNTSALRDWLHENIGLDIPVEVKSNGAMVGFSKRGINASLKKRGKAQRSAYAGLRELLENAVYDGLEVADAKHAHRLVGQDVYYSVMRLDGVDYSVKFKVDIHRSEAKRTYKDHKVVKIEVAPVVSPSQSLSGRHTARIADATDSYKLSTLSDGVKRAFNTHGRSQPRGVHAVAEDGQSIIHFFDASNDSTAGHEIYHVFRRVLEGMAEHSEAPTWAKQDWATACEFVGAKVGEVWSKEQEEMWAKAGEAYLWEGQAPSPGLRGAFSTFRRWLLNIYRTVTQIGVSVSPELRDVMDRMLATEAEIGEARAKMDTKPLFENEEVGELAQEYAEWAKKAAMASDPEVQRKVEAERAKLMPKWEREAKAHVDEHEGHTLLDAIVQSGGISRQALDDMNLTDKVVATLKGLRKKVVTKEGGTPQALAEQYEFESPEEFISYVLSVPSKAELFEDRRAELESNWRQSRDPEVSIMTEQYEKLMEREAEILAQATRGQALKGAAVKKVVRERTGQVRVGRIQMTEMEALKSVIRREAAAARTAYRAGKMEEALAAKERQRKAIAELRAKYKAKAEVKQIINYLKRTGKAARKGKAMTADANEQIQNILEGYDLRTSVTIKELDRRKYIAGWAQAQELQGKVVELPPHVLRDIGRVHYKEMSLDELRDLKRLVKNIDTIGRDEMKVVVEGKKQDRKVVIGGLVRSAKKNFVGKIKPEGAERGGDDAKEKVGKGLNGVNVALTKVLTMCDHLDGGETGWWTNTIYRPISEGLDRASIWKGKANKEMGNIMEKFYSNKTLSKLRTEKIHINERVGFMTREEILAVALNAGNAYNLNAVKQGDKWNDRDVQDILNKVSDHDWDFVQTTWDYLNSEFWPRVSDLYRELTGNRPEKVQPQPIATASGKKVRGGYYPLKAKADASVRASQLDEAQTVQEMLGGLHLSAQTRNGHTKARTDFGGKPVDLSLSVLFQHVSNVITDLEMRKSVIEVSWILNNRKVSDIVARTLGIKAHREMKQWLANCAGSGTIPEFTGIDRWCSIARKNKTVAAMGFKVTTFLSQFAGLLNSTGLVGSLPMLGGVRQVMTNPRQAYKFVEESSIYMSDRRNNFDRELVDRAKRLGRKGAFDKITEYSFYHVREADFFVSSITWLAAYDKAVEGGAEHANAVFEADKAVQMSQGGGRAADLAAIQRGGEFQKLFTMFYSFFSQQYQQFAKMYYDVRRTKNFAQFAARAFWLWCAPAIVSELLAGRGPDDNEDWASWGAKETAMYPFLTVPVLREMTEAFFSDYGAQKTIFGEVGATGKALFIEATDGDGDNLALFKKALRFSGYLAPLPTAQVEITIGQYVEFMTGARRQYSPRNIFLRSNN